MPVLLAVTLLLAWNVQDWMQHAFYPVLLLVLVATSLGVPVPEDVPLIAAGVILSQHPGVATWTGTLSIALLGVMCGDVVLYVLGGRWGPEVFEHRWVKRLITPERLEKMSCKFNRYGMWMCFFGRFFMGVRGAMCITAGVTRFPFWRFLLADVAGAVISIPLFVWLGYWFANVIPTLTAYIHVVRWGTLAGAVVILAGCLMYWRRRRRKSSTQTSQPLPDQTATQPSFQEQPLPTPAPIKRRLKHAEAKACP